MKRVFIFLIFIVVSAASCKAQEAKPRVFIFTDINIDKGDPDDRQSLVHLLWYADELQIEGIVPDRLEAQGMKACLMAFDAYAVDFKKYNFSQKSFPKPEHLKNVSGKKQ